MRATLVFTVSCLGACGSLVDVDYGGEPMFRLQGVAATRRSDPVSSTGVEAAALWQATSARAAILTPMPLAIAFPTFWIDVVATPSDEVAFQLAPEEPPIAEAYLHIVKPDRLAHAGELLASDYEHALVYVGAAVPPGSVTASYLGGSLDDQNREVTYTEIHTDPTSGAKAWSNSDTVSYPSNSLTMLTSVNQTFGPDGTVTHELNTRFDYHFGSCD